MNKQPEIPSAPNQATDTTAPQPKARRGFAAMDPALQREIASRGGASAHRSGRAHRFTSEEARAAVARKTSLRADETGGKA